MMSLRLALMWQRGLDRCVGVTGAARRRCAAPRDGRIWGWQLLDAESNTDAHALHDHASPEPGEPPTSMTGQRHGFAGRPAGHRAATGWPAVRSTQPPSRSQASPSAASSGVRSTCVGRMVVLRPQHAALPGRKQGRRARAPRRRAAAEIANPMYYSPNSYPKIVPGSHLGRPGAAASAARSGSRRDGAVPMWQ